jgi:hypothetical protein
MANVVSSSQILVTLIMEALGSSETSVLTGTTQHNISEDSILNVFYMPQDGIFHSHRRESFKSYIEKFA